ncbi:RNase H domain-containing protein [Trichonephila clavipes]|nr:RNase H domain-containing protein [Trichonephila clavipes]
MLPKEIHQLKYEAISVPQGPVRLSNNTEERKSSTCYLLILKCITSSSPVPLKPPEENLSASSISNYDCILSPFFITHPSERNAINTVQFSDKSTEDFPVICYTDGSKIDGRVGFAFVVFRSGVESENFQFRIRDECTVFVAELLCLNFAVKWITEQNSVISEYLICTDSLSSLDSLKCISSSNNIIVEIQKQLKSLRDKNISIDFAFVHGHGRT